MVHVRKIKPFVMPAAIILGLLFHDFCAELAWLLPYCIFGILILTFSTTRLRSLRFERLDMWLALFQIAATLALYLGFKLLTGNETLAQGIMLGALCPVAASVTVVAVMLGAEKKNTIAYTIIGNLLVTCLAPVLFVFISPLPDLSLTDSFFAILGRISTVIGLPFFVMLVMQLWMKPAVRVLNRYSGLSFYLWTIALLLSFGQTIDFIFLHGSGHWGTIAALGVGSVIICGLQFRIGRYIGERCGDRIAGQQLLGQKNSAMGIWMANTYLNPLASSFLAFYSVCQNILNSWQIWRSEKMKEKSC